MRGASEASVGSGTIAQGAARVRLWLDRSAIFAKGDRSALKAKNEVYHFER
jgi:hypothetical protein